MRTKDSAWRKHDPMALRRLRQRKGVVNVREPGPDEHAICRLNVQFKSDALEGAHHIEARLS
jgi:hypothetical protein